MLQEIDAKPVSNNNIAGVNPNNNNNEDDEENNNISNKMSSSNISSKIDLLDTTNGIGKKINKSYCLEGNIEYNPIIELAKHVIFPLIDTLGEENFIINRADKFGGRIVYNKYADFETDYVDKVLNPQDLKLGVAEYLSIFLEPIRNEFSTANNLNILSMTYP